MRRITVLQQSAVRLGAFFLVRGLTACSGGDEAIDPPQGCRDFVDAWCNKQAECAVPTDRARIAEDCHFVVALDVDCAQIKGLSSTYGACMYEVPALRCPSVAKAGLTLPSSCKGVLLK